MNWPNNKKSSSDQTCWGLQLVTRGVFNAPSDLRHMNLGSEKGTPCPTVTFTSRLRHLGRDQIQVEKERKKEGRSLGEGGPSLHHALGWSKRFEFFGEMPKTRTYCLDSAICMWPGFLQPHPILSPASCD